MAWSQLSDGQGAQAAVEVLRASEVADRGLQSRAGEQQSGQLVGERQPRKGPLRHAILGLLALSWVGFPSSLLAESLHLRLDNVQTSAGEVLVLVSQDKAGFTDHTKAFHQVMVPMATAQVDGIRIALPPGKYSISVLHDLNGNQRLDKGFLGMPKEPFGFSNNPKIHFGPPKFEDCLFEMPETPLEMTIRLAS